MALALPPPERRVVMVSDHSAFSLGSGSTKRCDHTERVPPKRVGMEGGFMVYTPDTGVKFIKTHLIGNHTQQSSDCFGACRSDLVSILPTSDWYTTEDFSIQTLVIDTNTNIQLVQLTQMPR